MMAAQRAGTRKARCFSHVRNSSDLSFEIPKHACTETRIWEGAFVSEVGPGKEEGMPFLAKCIHLCPVLSL